MQILAAFALAVVQAHLVQYLPSEIQAERRLTTVQLRQYPPLAALPFQLLVTILPEPDLLEHAYQKLVHIVLDTAGRLDEFALPRRRQLLTLFETKSTVILPTGLPVLFISRTFVSNFPKQFSYISPSFLLNIVLFEKFGKKKKNFCLTFKKGRKRIGRIDIFEKSRERILERRINLNQNNLSDSEN